MNAEECGSCEVCGESFQGFRIPEEDLRKGYYGEWDGVTPQFGSLKHGIQVRGVYDGILIWQCPFCQYMWPRFSEEFWERLHIKALQIITQWEKEKDSA